VRKLPDFRTIVKRALIREKKRANTTGKESQQRRKQGLTKEERRPNKGGKDTKRFPAGKKNK
jgi:hypothetical protein